MTVRIGVYIRPNAERNNAMTKREIIPCLKNAEDISYRDFQANLIPGIDRHRFIGVRTPQLKAFAKEISKDKKLSGAFIGSLPHKYFDENQLHAFILNEIKDFDECVTRVSEFLPYIDNWATCDQLSPKVFAKNRDGLLPYIDKWVKSEQTYTVRFGIGMLMRHFLDDDFDIKYPQAISEIKSDEYYINMMVAWYFATALAKQYEAILPFIEEKRLGTWVHNKTIQKAVESYRITDAQKKYLKSLKIK